MPLFFVYFSYFIAYIHSFDHIHTIHLSVTICRGRYLLRAEDLSSCSLAVFHGVLGIYELHFLIIKKKIQLYNFTIFCHKNPSPDSHWNNTDPQHWITLCGYVRAWWNRRPEDEFMNVQFRWVRRLEVSIYNGYITNQFQTTLLKGVGGGGSKIP
jgi:hypothetical protein